MRKNCKIDNDELKKLQMSGNMHVYVLIEDRCSGGYIGRRGKSIDKIRQDTGASICLQDRRLKFDDHGPKRALKITGSDEQVKMAIEHSSKRLLEVQVDNLAYKNKEKTPVILPEEPQTYEITLLSPYGLLDEKFRKNSHIVTENHNGLFELIDIWGKLELVGQLSMEILKSGLGYSTIDEK
eukprot:UN24393